MDRRKQRRTSKRRFRKEPLFSRAGAAEGPGAFSFYKEDAHINKYFAELVRRLNKDGISTGTPDSGKLPILLDGREIGIVVPGGGLRVRKESLDEPVANELYHRAGTIAAEELTELHRGSKLFLNNGAEHTPQQIEALTSACKQCK